MQASYEACQRGELPEHVPVAFQIPSVEDPGLAPPGCHIASAYGFFFPCDAPDSERGKLRDEMAERVIDRICQYLPDFRRHIVDRAVFSSDHFAAMHGATNGDFTHGLIHPDQMLAARAASQGSAHATPVAGLYLCGSACHPGPGVTFLPGIGCAREVLRKELR
jgi:phytoene dehydrogenase-like protein